MADVLQPILTQMGDTRFTRDSEDADAASASESTSENLMPNRQVRVQLV